MPTEIKVFSCDICRRRYDEFADACSCENQGLPVGEIQEKLSQINVGDNLDFQEESGGFSSHWCYSGKDGKVLAKYVTLDNDGHHRWVIIVSVSIHNTIVYERGVIEVHQEFGPTLMSPAEFCYKMGYAQHLIDSGLVKI